jgi:glucose/arabinose dehydrogenase
VNEVYATGFDQPLQVVPAPDGRMFVVEKGGLIRVLPAGSPTPLTNPFLKITNLYTDHEAGVLAMVLAPDFSTTKNYYVYYTSLTPKRNRLSRFTANGNTTALSTEAVIWQDTVDASNAHHGGGVLFGNDGKIYITTGDQLNPADPPRLDNTRGKVLRINSNGTIPTDNPFHDGTGPNKDEIWAYGLRNPFRASIDKVTGRIFIGDVGSNDQATAVEKVHILARGANYGWPSCGLTCGTGIAKPLYQYTHSGVEAAVIGGFVYRGKQFPAEYVGSYFFADYARRMIRRLTVNSMNQLVDVFNFEPADGAVKGPYGDINDLREGLDGAIYYVDFGGGQPAAGRIRRIRATATQPPVVVASATPQAGNAPLTVSFSSAGSFDPKGAKLTFSWDFGDKTSSTSDNPSHTYSGRGPYSVRLTVSNGASSATADPININVGVLPVANITAPVAGSQFVAGSTITFTGAGTDATLGNLPASALEWTVNFRHEGHIHPVVSGLKGTATGSFPISRSGHDYSGNTSYEITLTVTGSNGLKGTTTVSVFPRKVNLNFVTAPAGLQLRIDGIPRTAPFIHDALVGFQHTIEAPLQTLSGTQYTFSKWSDGGAAKHTITVPQTGTTFTATFASAAAPALSLRLPFDEASGTVAADASGLGNNGTLVNSPARVTGIVGSRALSFNGTSNYVRVNGSTSLNKARQAITVAVWVFRTANQTGWRSVISRQEGTGGTEHFTLAFNNNNYRWLVKTQTYSAQLGGAAPIGKWTHLAGTYDGAAVKLYVNGVQQFSTPLTGTIATSTNPIIIAGNINGPSAAPTELFNGRVDEPRIYDRALSASEIVILMQGGS